MIMIIIYKIYINKLIVAYVILWAGSVADIFFILFFKKSRVLNILLIKRSKSTAPTFIYDHHYIFDGAITIYCIIHIHTKEVNSSVSVSEQQ